MTTPAIELKGISKAFGPVQANKDINIRVMPGTIHGIIGENGAGKSTLMSILYGFYKADAGEIFINGNKTEIPDSQHAIAAGIGMVFQHFKLVENFTVLENIVLGAEDGPMLTPSLRKARAQLKQLADDYGLNVDPDAIIENIGVGQQQRVEILKALYRKAEILILDEPTAALGVKEGNMVLELIRRVRDKGLPVILISHNMPHVFEVADRIHIHRLGRRLCVIRPQDYSMSDAVAFMTGAKLPEGVTEQA